MIKQNEIYKCELCGNIVSVNHAASGTLVCCGKDMSLLQENTVEASKEKHIPVIEISEDSVTVKVGSTEHPMDANHYIEWIEVECNGNVIKKYLQPGEAPNMVINIAEAIITKARAYCNIHGLWSS